MPLQNILEVEIFDVGGVDFMGSCIKLSKNCYILVVVDYVSKWVEATALPIKNAHVTGEQRLTQLNEMEEFRNEAYENARMYKEKTKLWHDQ
ncbi:hypothetical protein MLD38_021336 [Melastoma candidum]|uniref:Uncharacterized protein n=1 Tax=Melastoma candidum TaxID=119954 RepID=A0ACB9QGR9_9MYRT|nr:hypothetical protein MLD38_021336 [Melastoma candidum]